MQLRAQVATAADLAKQTTKELIRLLDDPEAPAIKKAFRPLLDVQAAVSRFALQLYVAEAADMPIACIEGLTTPVPICVMPVPDGGVSPADLFSQMPTDLIAEYRYGFETLASRETAAAEYTPEEAKGFFSTLLERFVTKRFSTPSIPTGQTGWPIRVESRTLRARVHYSEEFIHVYDRVFADDLTSPVDGWLSGGNYRLGLSIDGAPAILDYTQLIDVPRAKFVRLAQ